MSKVLLHAATFLMILGVELIFAGGSSSAGSPAEVVSRTRWVLPVNVQDVEGFSGRVELWVSQASLLIESEVSGSVVISGVLENRSTHEVFCEQLTKSSVWFERAEIVVNGRSLSATFSASGGGADAGQFRLLASDEIPDIDRVSAEAVCPFDVRVPTNTLLPSVSAGVEQPQEATSAILSANFRFRLHVVGSSRVQEIVRRISVNAKVVQVRSEEGASH